MARSTFITGSSDCQWLRDTHLQGYDYPAFKSFELHGNEDCPDKLLLYASPMPMYTTAPVAVFVLQEDRTYKAHENPASFAHADIHAPKAPRTEPT